MLTAPRRTRKPLTVMLLVGAVLALLLGGAGPASAHAALSRSDPADASVLKKAPKRVTLTFTESVRLADGSLRVLSPRNERVNPRPAQHATGKTDTVQVKLRGNLPDGTYTVAWRVVSADSHPISGAFTFSIGKPSATAAAVPDEPPNDTAVSRVYDSFRYVAYGGFALLLGVAVFLLFCWPAGTALRTLRKLLLTGWAVLLGSTVVLLVLRGPYETGSGPASAFYPAQLGSTLTGRTGAALGIRLLLLAAVGVLLLRFAGRFSRAGHGPEHKPAEAALVSTGDLPAADAPPVSAQVRAVGVLLTLGLTVTWAAAEHASTGIQVPLAIPVAVLHLLAMAVWLGGLVALVVALRRAPADAPIPATAVARFSQLASTAVAVLVVTGVYQSWRQVGSWQALTSTEYGRTLVVKVTAVLLLLAAAAYSRRWTGRLLHEPQPSMRTFAAAAPEPVRVAQTVGAAASPDSGGSGDTDSAGRSSVPEPGDGTGSPSPPPDHHRPEPHRRSLRRSVAAEAVLGAVVLAITTLLTGTPPSRAATETTAAASALQRPPAAVVTVPFDVGTPNGRGKVLVTFEPGQVGENTVEALVFAADGGVATVPEMRLTLTQRAQKIGPLDAKLADQSGYWRTDSLRLPMAGTWTMNLTVRTTDIDQVTVSKNVKIRDLPTPTAP